MGESLLSTSEILLFGREVDDLDVIGAAKGAGDFKARVASTQEISPLNGPMDVDGIAVKKDDLVVVRKQKDKKENGLYTVADGAWTKQAVGMDKTVAVAEGKKFANTLWRQTANPGKDELQVFRRLGRRGRGTNQLLDNELTADARFARIYGFSFEGSYYDLPYPTLFLVHGEGESATDDLPPNQGARAPLDPSRTGVATADYQIANDIRVWPYDKADYSIRMDVMTGQLEQILLDVFFDGDDPHIAGGRVAGGRVAGGRVAGGRVSGGRVAGGRVAGGRVSGGRVGGSSD